MYGETLTESHPCNILYKSLIAGMTDNEVNYHRARVNLFQSVKGRGRKETVRMRVRTMCLLTSNMKSASTYKF